MVSAENKFHELTGITSVPRAFGILHYIILDSGERLNYGVLGNKITARRSQEGNVTSIEVKKSRSQIAINYEQTAEGIKGPDPTQSSGEKSLDTLVERINKFLVASDFQYYANEGMYVPLPN